MSSVSGKSAILNKEGMVTLPAEIYSHVPISMVGRKSSNNRLSIPKLNKASFVPETKSFKEKEVVLFCSQLSSETDDTSYPSDGYDVDDISDFDLDN